MAGFGGGVIRGLVGFIKHQYAYKKVGFNLPYFLGMMILSGIIGLLAAVVTKELGITFLGLDYITPAIAFIVGYAGGDFIENLYKIILKKPSLHLIIFVGIIFLVIPFGASADYLGQKVDFFVDSEFDLKSREQITATLQKISPKLYFYIDDDWWGIQNIEQRAEIKKTLNSLAKEFENKIYPTLTKTFGSERKPGIDKDERITLLIHPMIKEVGGYFNSGDGHPRIKAPNSNEREMIYLNVQHIEKEKMKSILAHEFIHLITFNQKDIIRGVTEEIWLNDVRAEYAATLLGYDDVFRGSNLESRVKIFLSKSSDSLTEWLNKIYDYGVVNLFAQYLSDHYGLKILTDSLHSKKTGILSINYALEKNGFEQDFSQIFTDWKIAVLVNDCGLGEKYCFLNENLKDFRITPRLNFLPFIGESVLQLVDASSNWSGNWHKIIGGKRVLTLEFDGDDRVDFKVPYLVCDHQENCFVNFLDLDKNQKGKVTLVGFNEKYASLTIMPSIQSKFSGFNGEERKYLFNWKASAVKKTEEEKELELRERLLAQIEFLKSEIARLTTEIQAILRARISCGKIENNLYFGGIRNNPAVRCLQEFLKSRGPEVYPEGLVTGNFLSLTKAAVIRFQEKHSAEILAPLGLERATGFVGPMTRAKINRLLSP